MKSRKPWTSDIADEIRSEIARMGDAARGAFAEVRQPVRVPTEKEKLVAFLQMPREQRQQMFAEMGPEEYGNFITDNLTSATKLLGPEAGRELMAYMYADGIDQQSLDGVQNEAQQFLTMLSEDPEQSQGYLEQELLQADAEDNA